MSEQQLAIIRSELLSGNTRFLGEQYYAYREYCTYFLTTKGYCNREQAEDIFCESILLLRQKIIQEKVTNLDNLKAFLLSISINLSREANRKEYRRQKKVDKIRLLFYDSPHIIEKEYDDETERIMRASKIAMRMLSERCEQILKLFYLEEMSMKQIAKLLGMASADVAKSSKSRCYKKWISAIKNRLDKTI